MTDIEAGSANTESETSRTTSTISSNQPYKEELKDGGAIELAFESVDYSVVVKNNETRHILKSLAGSAKAGRTLAIMGPSGSGKTSLLNILSLRTVNKNVKGDITLNGCPMTKRGKVLMGYVMQRDIFFKDLTVRETLNFAVRLNVGASKTSAEKTEMVEEVIEKLGLGKCQNTRVGDPMNRGISGGELKRLNVACELLNSPYVLFLDEPTSGLDSTAALSLCQELVGMCRERNLTVVMVIHQPSSQLFQTFDDLILMMNGNIVYHGAAKQIGPHLANMGYPCPVGFNIADYFTDLLNDPEMEAPLLEAYHSNGGAITLKPRPGAAQEVEELSEARVKNKPSYGSLLWTLLQRGIRKEARGLITIFDVLHAGLVALVIGTLWWQRMQTTDESAMLDQVGLQMFMSSFWMFVPVFGALMAFPPEREVIAKERSSKTYPISSYFFAKTFADIPVLLAMPTLFFMVIYFMAGFPFSVFSFFGTWIALLTCAQISYTFGSLVSCVMKDFKAAVVVVAVTCLLMMILGGFYVSVEDVPKAIGWFRHVSYLEYITAAVLAANMDSREYVCSAANSAFSQCPMPGEIIRTEMYAKSLPYIANIGIAWAFFLILRMAVYIALRFSKLLKPS